MNPSLKTKKYFISLILIILLIVGYFLIRGNPFTSQNLQERVGTVKRGSLVQRVTIAGSVEPIRTTVVTAPYEGYVKKLFVHQGQQIKAGDPVVSLAQSLQATENVFPIRAPFSGTVTQLIKSEGQAVKQNDSKDFILRIDDLTKMFIHANAPEIDIVKIKPSLEAVIKASAILSRNYKGTVSEISQAAIQKEQWGSRAQVEFLVKIEITDADPQLKPGMSAIVDIITNKKDGVLALDLEFIQKENDQYFVILKDGTRKNIKVGLQNETAFEITEGLAEGDVVRQVDFLKLIETQ